MSLTRGPRPAHSLPLELGAVHAAAVALVLAVISSVLGATTAPASASTSASADRSATIVAERSVGARVLELTIATPAFTAPTKVLVDLPPATTRTATAGGP